MPITAQSIVREVQRVMNDYRGIRVPASDLVPLLNQAQRLIQTVRPDSTSAVAPFALAAGSKQSLPLNAAALLDILSNSTGQQRRITKTNMALLDAVEPNWRTRAASGTIVHYMHDVRTPRTFWVYPPAIGGAEVELEASSYPVDVPSPSGNGLSWNTVSGGISLTDEFEQALIALTLAFAYRSDLEGAMNPALAETYMQQASTLLGVQLATTSAAAAKD